MVSHYSKEFLANEAAQTLLMGQSKIKTEFGIKTLEGLTQMILTNPAQKVAHAIMNGSIKIRTCYGKKNEIDVTDLIIRMLG